MKSLRCISLLLVFCFSKFHSQFKGLYTDATMARAGIDTTNPQATLDVNGSFAANGTKANLDYTTVSLEWMKNSAKLLVGWNYTGGKGEADFISNKGPGSEGGFSFYDYSNEGSLNQLLRINSNGNASLQGKLEAKELKVNLSPTADFVFGESYILPKLSDIEKKIKEDRHLPDIPSAAEMQANGVNIGDFQIKLLQKIEELTLHIIDQNKRIEKLENQIRTKKFIP